MAKLSGFDEQVAHTYFSVHCFNEAWVYLKNPTRTMIEDEQMLLLSHASLWHWSQRKDCTRRNLAIGYWQLARVYALLGQTNNARRYGQLCLDCSREEEAFYLGYAYEALARAEAQAGGNRQQEEKQQLLADLETIK